MFNFSSKSGRMGKVSNNLERHGTDYVQAFDIPITVMLGAEEVNDLLGKFSDRSMFNSKGSLKEPVELFTHCHPLNFEDSFEQATVDFMLSGEVEQQFTNCKISNIVLTPKVGGLTETKFTLRIRPDGDERAAMLDHQMREIHIAISDSTVAMKKSPKQTELNLGNADDGEEGEDGTPKSRRKRGNGDRPTATH